MGWHRDDEAIHGSLDEPFSILSLSLGASRTFYLQRADGHGQSKQFTQIRMTNGLLLAMCGLFQKEYLHKCVYIAMCFLQLRVCRVPVEGYVREARINITFRWILNHNVRGGCGSDLPGVRLPTIPVSDIPQIIISTKSLSTRPMSHVEHKRQTSTAQPGLSTSETPTMKVARSAQSQFSNTYFVQFYIVVYQYDSGVKS